MDASTTAKLTRIEQCQANAKKRSEQKRQATLTALAQLQREKQTITKAAVARQAGVSLVFLRSHPDLMQAVEEAARTRSLSASQAPPGDKAKDQIITALRRRLDEMKQQLAAKDQELRGKQREIDLLYGKLAAGSQLTDADLKDFLSLSRTEETSAICDLGCSGRDEGNFRKKEMLYFCCVSSSMHVYSYCISGFFLWMNSGRGHKISVKAGSLRCLLRSKYSVAMREKTRKCSRI